MAVGRELPCSLASKKPRGGAALVTPFPSPAFPSPALPGGKDCFCFSRQPVPSWHIWQGGGTGCLSKGVLGCLFLQNLRLSPKTLPAAPARGPWRWQSARGRRGQGPKEQQDEDPGVSSLSSPKSLPAAQPKGEGARSWP